jgi:hypothetical protein
MARFLKLRVRPGAALHSFDGRRKRRTWRADEEFVVRFEDAAWFLRDKGRRGYEIVADFEDHSGRIRPDIEPDD